MQRLNGRSSSWEIFSSLRARSPIIARADGRGFRKILEGLQKPYDLTFARSMVGAAVALFEESGLSPVLGFTFSDEINLLFLEIPFNGRVEKIDSVVASFISGALSLSLKRVVSLDCRVIPICETEVAMYLAERQDECWRNHVFSYGFFMLVGEGLSHSEAMEQLRGMRESEIHELVFNKGVNLAKTPAWERRGIMVYRKGGRVVQDWELPLFRSEDGLRLLSGIIASARDGSKKKDSSL
jgi:tRNA(His) guanylyltransferase